MHIFFRYKQVTKKIYISLFGGEPTLNYSTVQAVTEYAEKKPRGTEKEVHFNMTTNGVALSDEMIDYFATHNIKVLLSIDGLKSSHDRFRTDLRGYGTYERVINSQAERFTFFGNV